MVYEISGAKLHSAKRGNFCMGMVQWTHVFDECKHITSMHYLNGLECLKSGTLA